MNGKRATSDANSSKLTMTDDSPELLSAAMAAKKKVIGTAVASRKNELA